MLSGVINDVSTLANSNNVENSCVVVIALLKRRMAWNCSPKFICLALFCKYASKIFWILILPFFALSTL